MNKKLVESIMGIFDWFMPRKKSKTDIEYIENELKTTGTFQGRSFNPLDDFHIEKELLAVKPHGVSQPEAQRALNGISIGCPLRLSAGQDSSGCPALLVKTLSGSLIGDIPCSYGEYCQTLYNMLKAGIKIDFSLADKGQFWADSLKKKIWWCEVSIPTYDVWSQTGASVWATRYGRFYHCNPACNRKATRFMTIDEVEYRGMEKCPKCFDCKSK